MLTKLWRLIWGGCDHKYAYVSHAKISNFDSSITITRTNLECVHCGKKKLDKMNVFKEN